MLDMSPVLLVALAITSVAILMATVGVTAVVIMRLVTALHLFGVLR